MTSSGSRDKKKDKKESPKDKDYLKAYGKMYDNKMNDFIDKNSKLLSPTEYRNLTEKEKQDRKKAQELKSKGDAIKRDRKAGVNKAKSKFNLAPQSGNYTTTEKPIGFGYSKGRPVAKIK